MTDLSNMLDKMTDFLKTEVKTETLIGNAFQMGEFTCVPIIKVGMGFGAGGGNGTDPAKGSGEGAGGGAGLGMEPIGFMVTRGDTIQFIPTRTTGGLQAAIEKVPDLMEKFMESRKAKGGDSGQDK